MRLITTIQRDKRDTIKQLLILQRRLELLEQEEAVCYNELYKEMNTYAG